MARELCLILCSPGLYGGVSDDMAAVGGGVLPPAVGGRAAAARQAVPAGLRHAMHAGRQLGRGRRPSRRPGASGLNGMSPDDHMHASASAPVWLWLVQGWYRLDLDEVARVKAHQVFRKGLQRPQKAVWSKAAFQLEWQAAMPCQHQLHEALLRVCDW